MLRPWSTEVFHGRFTHVRVSPDFWRRHVRLLFQCIWFHGRFQYVVRVLTLGTHSYESIFPYPQSCFTADFTHVRVSIDFWRRHVRLLFQCIWFHGRFQRRTSLDNGGKTRTTISNHLDSARFPGLRVDLGRSLFLVSPLNEREWLDRSCDF